MSIFLKKYLTKCKAEIIIMLQLDKKQSSKGGKMETFKKLKQFRENKNLTMKQVSDKLGVSESCYCLYENGKRKASFETLVKLADIFSCSVNDFV